MTLLRKIRNVARDARGSVVIEFAILGPVIILGMIGVFHVALYMQQYNALRSVASDSARRIMVEYQRENALSSEEIRAVVRSIGVGAPYLLDTDHFEVTITQETNSRVTDATEFTLRLEYAGEDFLPVDGLEPLSMSYERPIFVVDETASEDEDEEA